MEPLSGEGSVPALVNVEAVRRTGRLPINRDAKRNRVARPRRSHDQMHVSSMEAVHDLAGSLIEDRRLRPDGPVANQRPLIECQARRRRINATTIQFRASARRD